MTFNIKFFEVEDTRDLRQILQWLNNMIIFDGTKYKVTVSIKEEK